MSSVDSHPEALGLHEQQSDATAHIELNPHADSSERTSPIPPDDVVMADAPVHHEDAPMDAPPPGDGVFELKADSAEAPLGFDEYDDEDADGDQYTDDVMQIDLDNADVEELERQKQILLEQKKKLIEQLKASGYSADMPEFAALEAEVLEAEAEAAAAAAAAAAAPGKKRGRPRKYSKGDNPLSVSGEFDGKRRRGRPPKKRTKLDEAGAYEPDVAYYQPEPARIPDQASQTFNAPKIKYTPSETNEAKRARAQWSLAETKSLLRLMEIGFHDADAIWEQLSQQAGNRKNLELVRTKRIQLAQKAAARGISIIELLREEILKMEASGIPAESGLMDDEPVLMDMSVSVSDVPVEPAGSKSRRGGRPKRPSELGSVAPASTPAPLKPTSRPSIRFTPSAESTSDVRTLVAELRQAHDTNRQILFHHTQMMEVMFRELQRLKMANKMLLQHAQLPVDFLVEEELPLNQLAGSSFQSSVQVPPNSLANSATLEPSGLDAPATAATAENPVHDATAVPPSSGDGLMDIDAAGEQEKPTEPTQSAEADLRDMPPSIQPPSPKSDPVEAPLSSKHDAVNDTDDETEQQTL